MEPFDHLSTVGIGVTDVGGCTGTLIGPFAMFTAAHCVRTTGFKEVRAWIEPEGGTERCISHSVPGPCPLATRVNNAYAQVHPNWAGLGLDQAVIIMGTPWRAPANVQSRWSRVAANWGFPLTVALNAAPVRIAGYGNNTQAGTGGGVGRRGVSTHNITFINDQLTMFRILRPTLASSGVCHGDSGMGPYNTTLLGGLNLTLGTLSGGTGAGNCQDPGMSSTYIIPDGAWIANAVRFFGGSCTTFSASGQPYIRCF